MKKIEAFRNRLAALTTEGPESSSFPPEQSLAACRSLQDQLRELKGEVLAELLALRGAAREKARRSLGAKPSLRELGKHRGKGARQLLKDVQGRVTGLFDDSGADAVEAWAQINLEIDARLDRLAELEQELVRAAGQSDTAAVPSPVIDRRDTDDDDIYAAAGAAARKGEKPGGFCPHCGRGVELDDRFCRHCGHRLD